MSVFYIPYLTREIQPYILLVLTEYKLRYKKNYIIRTVNSKARLFR